MITTTWTVSGMTCQHCATAVTEEVSELAGVTAVRVDQPSGSMVIESDTVPAIDVVSAAVAEAGNYTALLVGTSTR